MMNPLDEEDDALDDEPPPEPPEPVPDDEDDDELLLEPLAPPPETVSPADADTFAIVPDAGLVNVVSANVFSADARLVCAWVT